MSGIHLSVFSHLWPDTCTSTASFSTVHHYPSPKPYPLPHETAAYKRPKISSPLSFLFSREISLQADEFIVEDLQMLPPPIVDSDTTEGFCASTLT
jgi:hypothetical protein